MVDRGAFTVSGHTSPDNLAAEDVTYALVPQADTENGNPAGKTPDNVIGNTGLKRRTWPRGYNYMRRTEGLYPGQRDLVIAVYGWFPPQFSQVLGQVINEGIIIINNDNHKVFSKPL